ncbi:MAG: prenyltransferase [Nitrospirae bacterium]|nr:prenyltransferase [Nitrospirota bacterium]
MNVKMWLEAVRVIPRLDREAFRRLDLVARWLVAVRGAALVMTLFSATLAALLAALDGRFDAGLYAWTALGLLLAHGASNLMNDYSDYRSGIDQGNYFRARYGPHPLAAGLMTERELLTWAGVTALLAAGVGAYLVAARGPAVAGLALGGAFLMYAYSGVPFALKRYGFGEPVVALTWGPLMVGGTYYVMTGDLPRWVLAASVPYACAVTMVLFGKHIDKLEDDRARGIHTLPVLLGPRLAKATAIGLMVLAYGSIVALVAIGRLPATCLLVVLSGRQAWWFLRVYTHERPERPPAKFPQDAWPLWYVAFAFVFTRRFGAFYLAGLLIGVFLKSA